MVKAHLVKDSNPGTRLGTDSGIQICLFSHAIKIMPQLSLGFQDAPQ